MDLSQLAPILMVLVGVPGAFVVWATYFSKRPRAKDQGYYETLIDTAWQDADRIRQALEQEQGRRMALQEELDAERKRASELVADLQKKLDDCSRTCAILQHQLKEAESDAKSLRRALQRWQSGTGEAGA